MNAPRIGSRCPSRPFVSLDDGDVGTTAAGIFAQVFILLGLRGVFCGSVDSVRDKGGVVAVEWVDRSAQTGP